MGTIITKPWVEDKEIEKYLRGGLRQVGVQIHDVSRGRMPTADEFLKMVRGLTIELNNSRLELRSNRVIIRSLSKRIERLEEEKGMVFAGLDGMKEHSRNRALKLRSKLGLREDPKKVDGFAKIRGLLKNYAEKNEDSVRFLGRDREDA